VDWVGYYWKVVVLEGLVVEVQEELVGVQQNKRSLQARLLVRKKFF
jgi:hypothetical protein